MQHNQTIIQNTLGPWDVERPQQRELGGIAEGKEKASGNRIIQS